MEFPLPADLQYSSESFIFAYYAKLFASVLAKAFHSTTVLMLAKQRKSTSVMYKANFIIAVSNTEHLYLV